MRKTVAAALLLALGGCRTGVSNEPAPATSRTRIAAPPLAAVDFVQVRWVSESGRGTPYIDPVAGVPLALNDTVIVDMAGLDSAWVARDGLAPQSWDVVARLSRSAAAAFGATTATHVGKRLAVVVDGRITLTAQVTSALGSRVLLASGLARPVADSLVTRVDGAIAELRPFQPVKLNRAEH